METLVTSTAITVDGSTLWIKFVANLLMSELFGLNWHPLSISHRILSNTWVTIKGITTFINPIGTNQWVCGRVDYMEESVPQCGWELISATGRWSDRINGQIDCTLERLLEFLLGNAFFKGYDCFYATVLILQFNITEAEKGSTYRDWYIGVTVYDF